MSAKNVIKRFFCLVLFVLLGLSVLLSNGYEAGAIQPVAAGMKLHKFKFTAPGYEKEQQYLALQKRKPFYLSDIPCKLIVLELFSVYCPHCMKQAPKLNKLYNLIKQDDELFAAIKMIGVAALSDQTKTDKWRDSLKVPFPLLADPEGYVFNEFGNPGIPYTLVLKNSGQVLYSHIGETDNIEELFREIKKFYQQQ